MLKPKAENMESFSGKLQANNCGYLEKKRVQSRVYKAKFMAVFEACLDVCVGLQKA